MKTMQFHVRAALPKKLEPLWRLAKNVWWSWSPDAIALFRRISPDAYRASGPCPLKLLNTLPGTVWQELAEDEGFLDHLEVVVEEFEEYMANTGNSATNLGCSGPNNGTVAYFSMEYGLHESIPLYSGGLGVLAGDHLKTASDLAVPLIAVGLFYSEGYFRQKLERDGWQTERYEANDPFFLPMQLLLDSAGNEVRVHVRIAGQNVAVRVWRLDVGKVPLFLLDTDVPSNSADARRITSRLYAGGTDMRIQQEMVLGIAGVRAIRALGYEPKVFHLNEGHSAFLALERISQSIKTQRLTWQESLLLNKGSQVFTVHTPVPAGNDSFPIEKLKSFFGDVFGEYHVPEDEFLKLGMEPNDPSQFSMPVFAIRTSAVRNGVSKLHQKVSQRIWKPLWPRLAESEVPIEGVTNGVHVPTWLALEYCGLYERYLGKGWNNRIHDERLWERVDKIPDSEVWDIHLRRKSRLIATVVSCAEKSSTSPYGIANELVGSLRPEYLTLGFARRFATYKRGALIFRDIERLKRIVLNEQRPVQIFIAGKAHPRDNAGKEVIRRVHEAIARAGLWHRIVFVEDYDMNIAQRLVRGVDIWINNPIRFLEASGTSGMKVSVNGGLNFSVLDGWWDEAFHPDFGWPIGMREGYPDDNTRDEAEAEQFYSILEQQIIPLYYESAVPTEWIRRMKRTMAVLTREFSAQRMVEQYCDIAYKPCLDFSNKWSLTSLDRVKTLQTHVRQREELLSKWSQLRVLDVNMTPGSLVDVGEMARLTMKVHSPFPADWIRAELIPVEMLSQSSDHYGDAPSPIAFRPDISESSGENLTYQLELSWNHPGVRTYAIRITPSPTIFPHVLDLHLVTRYE